MRRAIELRATSSIHRVPGVQVPFERSVNACRSCVPTHAYSGVDQRDAAAGRAGAALRWRGRHRVRWEERGLWVFVVGLAFVAAGGWGLYRDRRLSRRGERAPGVVVDHHWRAPSNICHLVVEFRTADGQVARASTGVGSKPPAAAVGERVPVVYDPEDPKRVEVDSWTGRALWMPVLVGVGGLGILVWAIYHGKP